MASRMLTQRRFFSTIRCGGTYRRSQPSQLHGNTARKHSLFVPSSAVGADEALAAPRAAPLFVTASPRLLTSRAGQERRRRRRRADGRRNSLGGGGARQGPRRAGGHCAGARTAALTVRGLTVGRPSLQERLDAHRKQYEKLASKEV
jgi:hypothetical protein